MNGTLIWNDNKQNGTETKPGVITLEGRDNGLSIKQDWNIILLTDETMVVYYCGEVQNTKFEGVLVMSATEYLTEESKVREALDNINFPLDNFCVLNPAKDCLYAPEPFIPYEERDLKL